MRIAVASGLFLWAGSTLLLSRMRFFSRPTLADRVRPYAPTATASSTRPGIFSVESFRDVVAPLAAYLGGRLASAFGVDEDLETRLNRIHSTLDPMAFRVRQLAYASAAFFVSAFVSIAIGLPAPMALLFILGAPLLGFLIPEQQLASQSERWQRRVFLELPIVAEQLGMLLSAGYSLGGALNRIARRGKGSCGRDLTRACSRIQQGIGEVEALREWAGNARVEALDRLVSVLALNREAGDLGRLIAEEARSIRRDVHRKLIETIEKRGQQVWIPVTVATLVPGVILIAIPFIEAMRLFTES